MNGRCRASSCGCSELGETGCCVWWPVLDLADAVAMRDGMNWGNRTEEGNLIERILPQPRQLPDVDAKE